MHTSRRHRISPGSKPGHHVVLLFVRMEFGTQGSVRQGMRHDKICISRALSTSHPNKSVYRRSADFECACGCSPVHIASKTPLYCRTADLECAYFLCSEHIVFQRLDDISEYWAGKIVNVYNLPAESITFSRKGTSNGRKARVGRGKGRVPVLRAKG